MATASVARPLKPHPTHIKPLTMQMLHHGSPGLRSQRNVPGKLTATKPHTSSNVRHNLLRAELRNQGRKEQTLARMWPRANPSSTSPSSSSSRSKCETGGSKNLYWELFGSKKGESHTVRTLRERRDLVPSSEVELLISLGTPVSLCSGQHKHHSTGSVESMRVQWPMWLRWSGCAWNQKYVGFWSAIPTFGYI